MAKKDNARELKKETPVPETENEKKEMPFAKANYIWVLIGVAFIALGFILMIGGGSSDSDVFNSEMFDFQHLTLAPILCLIGFGIEFYAIMKKPSSKN
jgi:Protein of unknown function (DUF3098).